MIPNEARLRKWLFERWKPHVGATVAGDLVRETFIRVKDGTRRKPESLKWSTFLYNVARSIRSSFAKSRARWEKKIPPLVKRNPRELRFDLNEFADSILDATAPDAEEAEALRLEVARLRATLTRGIADALDRLEHGIEIAPEEHAEIRRTFEPLRGASVRRVAWDPGEIWPELSERLEWEADPGASIGGEEEGSAE